MSNFKPGDLALTLADGVDWPAGTVVTLHTYVPVGHTAIEPDGYTWVSLGEWFVTKEGDSIGDVYLPAQLMPLHGDFTPEQQKVVEEVV